VPVLVEGDLVLAQSNAILIHLARETGRLGASDIACCAYLFWPEQAGLELSVWPNIVRWIDETRDLRGWRAPYDLLK
jgi:glutathione S-transferase